MNLFLGISVNFLLQLLPIMGVIRGGLKDVMTGYMLSYYDHTYTR